MSKLSQFLDYARRTKDAVALKASQYVHKLRERGYSDTDILNKLYHNYGFLMGVGQQGLAFVGANPYPHEHSARLISPREMRKGKFRRQNNKFGRGVHAIWGILKKDRDQTVVLQSIHFDSSKFSAQKAMQWLRDHDMKMSEIKFEAASGEKRTFRYGKSGKWMHDTPRENPMKFVKRGDRFSGPAGIATVIAVDGDIVTFKIGSKPSFKANVKHLLRALVEGKIKRVKISRNPAAILPKIGDIIEVKGVRLMFVGWLHGKYQLQVVDGEDAGHYYIVTKEKLENTPFRIVDRG